jgi:hypothetical protein
MTEQQDRLIFDSLMNQISVNYHPNNIVNHEDIERAIDIHPLFSAISQDWNLSPYSVKGISLAKSLSRKYKNYIFTSYALKMIQRFFEEFHQEFPNRKSIEKKYPFLSKVIDQIYMEPKGKVSKFDESKLKEIQIDPESSLFHTTNAFEIFEMQKDGTPYPPAWFSIDEIFPISKIEDFHPLRGPVRVIEYKWIPWKTKDFSEDYPFIDTNTEFQPRILDARKMKKIPSEAIEQAYKERGLEINLPDPDLEQDLLMTYGEDYRPFIINYLKKIGFDGVYSKSDQIVLFEPKRWIVFEGIEQGDVLYSALVEALTENSIEKLIDIANKYNVDYDSLRTLYLKNKEDLWTK